MKRLALSVVLAAALTGCGQGQFANPFAVKLDVTLTPAALTLTPGETKSTTVSAKDEGANVTGFDVTATAPNGLSVRTNGPLVYVTAAADAAPGTYPAVVTASVPGGSGTGILNVTVSPAPVPTYHPTLSETTLTLQQGQAHTISAAFTTDPGYTRHPIVVDVENGEQLNAKVSGLNSVLLAPSASTVPGTYVLTVVTSDGISEQRLNATVKVEVPKQ